MKKLPEIKVGDVITYNDGSQRQISFIENEIDIDKILKIERPAYNTIYEKKDILDKEEKEYLSAVIKPFRNKVIYISKSKDVLNSGKEYLAIELKNDEGIYFPDFTENTMYKGMKANKEYTLKKLGL